MTSQNRPRGRRDRSRPKTSSARKQFLTDVALLDTAIRHLPIRDQQGAYRGHAKVFRQFTKAVRDRISAGQTHYDEDQ